MDHCTVSNNMISNSRIGVFLYNGWYCDIEDNEIFNSGHGGSLAIGNSGIEIYAGAFLSVRNNLIHHNAGYGIQNSAWRSAITNNTIHDNELGGIFSEGSSFISITGCIVANNGGVGVAFKGWSYFHAGNCIIETSYIHHNEESGIYFYCVDDGEAHDNRIEFNGEWGIYMLECLNTTESNNVFDSNTLGDVSP
jgi:parallel beta-helix repeat protein